MDGIHPNPIVGSGFSEQESAQAIFSTVKTVSIAAIFALLYFANSSELHEAEVTQRKIIDLGLKHIERMSSFLDESETTEPPSTQEEPTARLQRLTLSEARLHPAGLQPGDGVQLGASGLTPPEEWNRTFKRKERR